MLNSWNTSELSPWRPVAIPPRSRLYHLAPIGIGTSLVESATGYSSRLAVAHSVTLAVLFGYEIAPLLDKNHLRNSEARSNKHAVLSNSFRTLAPAVDGHGITAETYIASLHKLTMRDDLRFLTMLPWKEVISHRHLVRTKRAWCTACYYDWHHNGATVYEPLAWSLAVVTVCIRHHRRLQSRCHRCKQGLRPLASRSRPGYCSMCHAWLGEPTQSGIPPEEILPACEEFEWQKWVYEQTGNLLAVAPTLATFPQRLALAASISRCIRASSFKSELAFARNCGLSQSSVNGLCRGACVPQLSTLMRVSFFTRTPIVDIVLGRIRDTADVLISSSLNNRQLKVAKAARPSRPWSTSEARKVRRSFEELLRVNPPLPMVKIRMRLNHPASTLLTKFPDLCRQAVVRYKEHVENCRGEFWQCVQDRLEKQLTERTPISVAEVAREVGRSRTAVVRRFPELCARLFEHWTKRRNEYWNEVEAFLQKSLEESTQPLRLKDIAKLLKMSHTSLYRYFPQLCRDIAERYSLHAQQTRALKKESLRDKVRRIAISLYEQHIYPSVREVSKRLAKPASLRGSKVALASLREVRDEYGLRFMTGNLLRNNHQ